MLFCPLCGAPLKAGATHCLECGEPLMYVAPPTTDARKLPEWHVPQAAYAPPEPVKSAAVTALYPAQVSYEPSLLEQWFQGRRVAKAPQSLPARTRPDAGALVAQGLYFFCIGWWLSQVWMIFAWLACVTVVGRPLGMQMLRLLPQITFLSSYQINFTSRRSADHTHDAATGVGVRMVYFVLIGWWLLFLWLQLAWVAGITIIGLPVAEQMIKLVPTVTTLARR